MMVLARAICPAHTMSDGDTIFALATGEIEANVTAIGAFAAEMTAAAIRNGVREATSLGGVQSVEGLNVLFHRSGYDLRTNTLIPRRYLIPTPVHPDGT